jgi:hypothetical protein
MADKHRMRYDQLGEHWGRITLLTGMLSTRFGPCLLSLSVDSGIMQGWAEGSALAIRMGRSGPKIVAGRRKYFPEHRTVQIHRSATGSPYTFKSDLISTVIIDNERLTYGESRHPERRAKR